MPATALTAGAQRQNSATLAAALGLTEARAAQLLDLTVLVTADPADATASAVATDIAELLGRTVREVTQELSANAVSAELVIGAAAARTTGKRVFLQVKSLGARLTQEEPSTKQQCSQVHRLLCAFIACYTCAALLSRAIEFELPFGLPSELDLPFGALGLDLDRLREPIELGHAYLAGAGAIGNGLLWAGRHLDLHGRLEIADDDHVDSGNLNRQVWFQETDIGDGKAARLAHHAQPFFPHLTLVPRPSRLQALQERSNGPWLPRLIVAVDSRRARRALQTEFPGEVFDASTTDIREVVIHYHRQPTDLACLSCIYEPDSAEFSREAHIAEHLGVSVEEVRSERVTASAAERIQARFSHLEASTLIGLAYDSLFRTLCGEGSLKAATQREETAPFAFVSCLAGVMLAFELVRRLAHPSSDGDFNYWRISAWHAPLARRRRLRVRQPDCAFCSNPTLRRVNELLWHRKKDADFLQFT